MEYTALLDFLNQYEIKNPEEYLIKRVQPVSKDSYRYKNYNKRVWINRLASYYHKQGIDVGKISFYITKKTGLKYHYISRWLDVKYKQNTERLDELKDQIINFYLDTKNLTLTANTYNTTTTSISHKLNEWGMSIQSFKHIMKMKELKHPPNKLSFLERGKIYRLHASWCDYFFHDYFGNNGTVIEEKQTLSKYNFGLAAIQVIMGKELIEANTEYIVDHKIILAHKINRTDSTRILNALEDYAKYLDIDLIIPLCK